VEEEEGKGRDGRRRDEMEEAPNEWLVGRLVVEKPRTKKTQ
jgi:hypothetical protein